MARGVNYQTFYVDGPGDSGRRPTIGDKSIAELVLSRNNVPYDFSDGSPLTGYDIKSQDCVNMLKLSLMALSNGAKFKEVYCKPDGVVTVVDIGVTTAPPPTNLLSQSITSQFVNKIDYVLVKGRQPPPVRYHGGSVNVMGQGNAIYYNFTCPFAYSTKNTALNNEAWAEFERSPQSEETQALLRGICRRSQWEQLVGYKVTYAGVPRYASISMSQTTPRLENIPFTTEFNTILTLPLGEAGPESGGVVDISNVNAAGAEVLDLVRGSDLFNAFKDKEIVQVDALGNPIIEGGRPVTVKNVLEDLPFYTFDTNDFYVLLNHECGLMSISRGQNWFVLPSDNENFANVILRKSGAFKDANDIYNGAFKTVNFFRRNEGNVASISDVITSNVEKGLDPFETLQGAATANPLRGLIIVGLGGQNGIEVSNLSLSYTVASPSIQLKSPHGDAPNIAASIAAGGVIYTSIVVKEAPAPTGKNGEIVYPVAPPDQEGVAYDVDSAIDELEGTIIDITAPFLGEQGVAEFSANVHSLINGDSGNYKTYSFVGGGYNLLPGMKINNEIIYTIDHSYADKDSVTTNITTGPFYYPAGSYSDSYYVKRSESLSRIGTVVAGSNRDGIFVVEVEGRGRYDAITSTIEPIYPGDKVEVRILNVPVEKD